MEHVLKTYKFYKLTHFYYPVLTYVGCTTKKLEERFNLHFTNAIKNTNPISFALSHDDKENWNIELLFKKQCKKEEALEMEKKLIRENNTTLNKVKYGMSKKEREKYHEVTKDYRKNYYQANKEKIDENHKNYVESNKEKRKKYQKEYNKKYVESNKEKIKNTKKNIKKNIVKNKEK